MIDTLLSIIAPHLCCGCGKNGIILCYSCKYNSVDGRLNECILCGSNNNSNGICVSCEQFASRGWCIGERSGVLRRLVDGYKFERARTAYKTLAELLDECIEELPDTTVVVPIPTVASHVRQRGYDHAALLARAFARKRGLAYRPLLVRATSSSQRGSSRMQRLEQAKHAFTVRTSLSPNKPYLLVDDIITTGATLSCGAAQLRKAGAREVWVAAVARQPID